VCILPPPPHPLFPYTTLFRSRPLGPPEAVPPPLATALEEHAHIPPHVRTGPHRRALHHLAHRRASVPPHRAASRCRLHPRAHPRSEEHTSELQSRENFVCRLL